MKAEIIETLHGPAGTADLLQFTELVSRAHEATVATWFLNCPGQSPAWSHFMLSVCHLRDIEGVEPANVRVPASTHELIVFALGPTPRPRADRPQSWQMVTPLNVSEQIQLPDDAAAIELARLAARAMVEGRLWAEPMLSGQLEPWRSTLIITAAHMRGEPHAGCFEHGA